MSTASNCCVSNSYSNSITFPLFPLISCMQFIHWTVGEGQDQQYRVYTAWKRSCTFRIGQKFAHLSLFQNPYGVFLPTFTKVLPTVNLCKGSCMHFDHSIFNILLGLYFRKIFLVLHWLYSKNQSLKKTGMLGWNWRWWISQESLAVERISG